MKLVMNIVGKSISDIEKALEVLMMDVKNKQLEPNCYIPLNDKNNTEIDYFFTDGNDVFDFNSDSDYLVIHPYTQLP